MLSVSPFSLDYDLPYENHSEQVQTENVFAAATSAEHYEHNAVENVPVDTPTQVMTASSVTGKISSAKQSKEKALTTITLTWKSTYPSDTEFRITNTATGEVKNTKILTCKFTGLDAGKTYQCTIVALDASGEQVGKIATVKAKTLTPKQSVVKSVKIAKGVAAGFDSLKLQWQQSAATDVTEYRVQYIASDGLMKTLNVQRDDLNIDSKGVAVMKDSITGLPAGTKVKFQVTAVTSTGIASTVANGTASTKKAQLPTLKKVKATAPSEMTIEWADPKKDQVDGYTLASTEPYVLYYREAPGKNDSIEKWQWKPANATSATITGKTAVLSGLKSNTKYEFMIVSTYMKGGDSIQVAPKLKSAKTKKDSANMLSEPTLVDVSATSNTINVEWNTVTGASGYVVQYATNSAFTANVDTVNTATISATISGLDADTPYYVRVQATSGSNDSAYSTAKLVKTTIEIDIPSDLEARQGTGNTVELTWTADPNAAKYVVERSTGADDWTTLGESTTGSYTDGDASLADETTYHYRVTVYSDAATPCGVSNTSSVLFVDVEDESRIMNLTVVQEQGKLIITWDEIPGEFFYWVEIYDGVTDYTWELDTNSLDTSLEESEDDGWFVPVLGKEYEVTITGFDWSFGEFETTVKVTFGTQHTVDFEDIAGALGSDNAWPNNLAWNGADAYVPPAFLDDLGWEYIYDAGQVQYFIDGIGFACNMSYTADWGGYYSWSGFGLSTATDNVWSSYVNEMSSITCSGAGGSNGYGIAYWMDWAPDDLMMQLPEGALIDSMMITNTVYAYGSMTGEDSYIGSGLASDEFLTLIVVGLDADGGELGEVKRDLGRGSDVLEEWTKLDLSSLAGASQLQFKFESNVEDPVYGGITLPTYFAFDNIVYYTV